MNLKQAVESGWKIKLPEEKVWLEVSNMKQPCIPATDAIRDDWMVEEVYEGEAIADYCHSQLAFDVPSNIGHLFDNKRTRLRIEVVK